jgi:FG-GAP-like repeat
MKVSHLPLLIVLMLLAKNIFSQTDFEKTVLLSKFQIVNQASDLQTGDMDGDGDLDYIVCAYGDGTIRWFENNGNGEVIMLHVVYTDESLDDEFVHAKAADLDNDGDLDIFVRVNYDYEFTAVFWFENLDGTGNFGEKQEIYYKDEGSSDIYALDVDQDGDKDLVSDIGDSFIEHWGFTWMENLDGNGTSWSIHDFADADQTFGFSSLFMIGDIDNDGIEEIVTSYIDTDPFSGEILGQGIRTYFNDGSGNFVPSGSDLETEDWPRLVKLADLNQDGFLDVLYHYSITNNSGVNYIKWAENNGAGIFGSPQTIAQNIESFQQFAAIDLDNDLDNDVIYTSYSDKKIFEISNNGNETFQAPVLFDVLNSGPKFIAVGDFDLNGSSDFIITDIRPGTSGVLKSDLLYYRNDNGTFDPMQRLLYEASETEEVIWADLNSDGYQDVIGIANGIIYWFESVNGNGDYAPPKDLVNSINGVSHLVARDLDGDNDLDLVVNAAGSNRLGVLFNTDGQGTMGPYVNLGNNIKSYYHPVVMDIENDGDLDIISASGGNSTYEIFYFENIDGLGSFGTQQLLKSTTVIPLKLGEGDLDNDGDLDLLFHSNFPNSSIHYMEHVDGAGTYADPVLIVEDAIIERLGDWDLEDIDQDGIKDISIAISGWDNEKTLFWLKHLDGSGTIEQERRSISNNNDFFEVVGHEIVDLDQDGDQDVVLLRRFFLSWYENLDGSGNFSSIQEIGWSDRYSAFNVKDINGDSRSDILTGAEISGEVAWFRNVNYLGISQNQQSSIGMVPNPTSGLITFHSQWPITKIILSSAQGSVIDVWMNKKEVDISSFPAGMYFATLVLENGELATKKIVKY